MLAKAYHSLQARAVNRYFIIPFASVMLVFVFIPNHSGCKVYRKLWYGHGMIYMCVHNLFFLISFCTQNDIAEPCVVFLLCWILFMFRFSRSKSVDRTTCADDRATRCTICVINAKVSCNNYFDIFVLEVVVCAYL
jgi:hypothetical protein